MELRESWYNLKGTLAGWSLAVAEEIEMNGFNSWEVKSTFDDGLYMECRRWERDWLRDSGESREGRLSTPPGSEDRSGNKTKVVSLLLHKMPLCPGLGLKETFRITGFCPIRKIVRAGELAGREGRGEGNRANVCVLICLYIWGGRFYLSSGFSCVAIG